MKKPKLSLCLIVKPTDDEAQILDRCLGTVYNYVDEICLTITGENKKCEEIGKKYHAEISHFKWIDDFSAARNYNFEQATGDYIFWVDTDDLVQNAKQLPSVVKEMEKERIDVGVMDYLYDFDEYGRCTVKHRKTRIIRNDGCVKWFGKVHEDFKEERKINGYYVKDVKIEHRTDEKRIRNAKKRNLRIALSNLKKNPNDPRSYWLVANAYNGVGEPERAIEMLLKFIPISSSESEKCLAWHRLAGSYLDIGETGKAIEADLEAQRMKPWYPDSYLGLGEIFYNMQKYRHAKEYLIQGLSKKIPEDEYIVWNPRDYDFNPLMLLGKCYLELAKPKEAQKCFKHCLKIYPKHPRVIEILDALEREIEKIDKIDEICEKAKKVKNKKEIKKLIDSAPVEMRSHPKLCHLRNVHFIKKKSSGKDLVIYCFWTKERFNPEIVEKIGRGGSEEAVCHMSKRLADMGWNVTVYANCGHEAKKFGKVMWKPFWEYNIRDKEDVLIIWRHPMMFDFKEVNAAKKYVWLHDVLKPKEFTAQRLSKIDKIFALSKWQRNLFPEVDDKKFLITGNGLEPQNIDVERDPHRLIYTSSYDRGLKTLLKLFPYIKKEDPKAELHIFYGWHVWDAMWKGDVKMEKEKEEILELMEQPGVFEHGRVSQEQIVREYSKAGIWAYPTEFGEISCISAMKAQAYGAYPITTTMAALDETVQKGVKIDSKQIYSDEKSQQEFLDAVIDKLKNPPSEEERKEMMDWAKKHFNWDKVAQKWNEEFKK